MKALLIIGLLFSFAAFGHDDKHDPTTLSPAATTADNTRTIAITAAMAQLNYVSTKKFQVSAGAAQTSGTVGFAIGMAKRIGKNKLIVNGSYGTTAGVEVVGLGLTGWF